MKLRNLIHYLHLLGISGFLGSIFSMILLGRSHDFSLDWQEIYSSRRDILNIMLYVNIPSLVMMVLTDIFIMLQIGFRDRQVRIKMILNIAVVIMTIGVILTVGIAMVDHAENALRLTLESHVAFNKKHMAEDILGPINLLMFLVSIAIGLKLEKKP